MRYVVTTAPHEMSLREGPPPVPADGQVLVRVEYVGLCGSDYHLYDGTHPYARFPQIQGHELVGTLPSGQRVAVEPLRSCGACFACRRGRYNCCTDLKVMGVHIPGGLAEFIAVPAGRVFPVDDVPAEVAVLTEPVSVGLQAITRAGVAVADTVVVVGAGPIGLCAALAAVDRGARVLVADKVASRLEHARRLGVHETTLADNLAPATADFTGGDGAAVVVDATGVPAVIRLAVDIVAHSGTVVVVGISGDEVALPVIDFSRKELNLLGSRNNTGLFPSSAELVSRHAALIAPMVTQIYDLNEVPEAIKFARSHPEEVMKVAIRV